MASSEASAVLVILLQRRHAKGMIASILDSLTWPMACTIANKSTSAVLNTSTTERQSVVNVWLDCISASSIATREPHSRSELWSTVYSQLSEHFRLSDLAEHFHSLDQKELAKCLLQHWVPKLSALPTETHVGHATLPQDIEWKIRFNRQQHHNPDQGFDEALNDSDFNHPLTDLISTLVAHNIPYETLMVDIYRYWQKTKNPMFIADRTFEICGNPPRIAIPSTTTTALVRTFLDNGATEAAWHVVDAAGPMPAFPASSFREFVMDYVQKSRHWIIPWRMIDRWADEDEASPAAHQTNRKLISPELVSFVQDIAYAWAQSPLITPRTAYRHVWECYRFLNDYNIPVSRLLCRAFLRAGVVRYIEARQTLAKTQVHFVLSIVGKLEGKHVQERLDKMVYDYWNTYRRFAKVKPAEQLFQEKWLGLRVAPDGTKTFRKWKSRVRRKANAALLREKALFDEGMAVQPTAPEGVDAPPSLAVEAEIQRPDSLLMTLKTAVQDFTGDTQRMEREAFESRETDPEADNPFRPVSDDVRNVRVGEVVPFQPFAGDAAKEGQPGSPMLSPPRPRRQLRQRTYDIHDEDLSQAMTVQSIHAKETNAGVEQRACFPIEVGDSEPAAVEVEAAPPASVDLSLEQLKLRTYELELELAGLQHKLDLRQEAGSGSMGLPSLNTSGVEEQTWMETLDTDANRSTDTSI
ncbi:hypothetical protein BDY17DRAFT_311583 [Neohortaea acidophila]|uniref:Uncharacterized protein n=1 Tax=Neohortaea acidophila TaxID=245834 RepID=A0A6A6PR99_9PEZI|nr:uncharacterized protein BDY17DRAFT_311583 [Neohortaea acidophila]KAF2481973.1 hypothetical protein BDY17DRAFT_311583 [Neohortaea acidophila]